MVPPNLPNGCCRVRIGSVRTGVNRFGLIRGSMIILFGAQKGGTGKSTLAQNVAVALAREGRDIVLLDTDVQGTTAKWMARRRSIETVKSIHCLQARGNLIDQITILESRQLAHRVER